MKEYRKQFIFGIEPRRIYFRPRNKFFAYSKHRDPSGDLYITFSIHIWDISIRYLGTGIKKRTKEDKLLERILEIAKERNK
jgi:hypothetical protein